MCLVIDVQPQGEHFNLLMAATRRLIPRAVRCSSDSRHLTHNRFVNLSSLSQAHTLSLLQLTRSHLRSAHAGGLRPNAPLLRSYKDSQPGPCMRPIVNLEGRTAVLGALRQAEDGVVLDSVAETFDRYVLTLQVLAGRVCDAVDEMLGS